jgi:hypothetical protein
MPSEESRYQRLSNGAQLPGPQPAACCSRDPNGQHSLILTSRKPASFDLIVRNANLPDSRSGIDLAIASGRIAAVAPSIEARAAKVIDAEGVTFDILCHCRAAGAACQSRTT